MAYDLEQQEQLDKLHMWWSAYGQAIMTLTAVALFSYVGYKGWIYYQQKQSLGASVQYEKLTQLELQDIKQVRQVSGQIIEQYSSTPYAPRAALIAARANYESGDIKSARAQIEWAVENAAEDSVKSIAQLQLASLQVAEKKYDDALNTLEKKHDVAFDGLLLDLKGDILVAKGKLDEAKKTYAEALAKLDKEGRFYLLTEQKLDALGS